MMAVTMNSQLPMDIPSSSRSSSSIDSESSSNDDSCNRSSFCSPCAPTTLSYKHQQLPNIPQLIVSTIRDKPVNSEDGNDDSTNPVLMQVMSDLNFARKTKGDNDASVAEAWNALGLVRIHMQRDVHSAKSCHEEALRIFQNRQLTRETAITLLDLGYCFERLDQREEALRKYRQALIAFQSGKVSEDHPQVISAKRAVARMIRR